MINEVSTDQVKLAVATQVVNSSSVAISSSNVSSSKISNEAVNISEALKNKSSSSDKSSKVSQEMDTEQLKQLASKFEKALSNSNVEVKFGASPTDSLDSSFSYRDVNFQVVDKDTGKIVRQFPPDSLSKLAETASFDSGIGLLIDIPA